MESGEKHTTNENVSDSRATLSAIPGSFLHLPGDERSRKDITRNE
jgi:hypothetical protein